MEGMQGQGYIVPGADNQDNLLVADQGILLVADQGMLAIEAIDNSF